MVDIYLSVYNMCCPCMIATIPLPTRSKLNCFISAWEMLAIIWHCAIVLLFFFVKFCNLIHHFPKEKRIINHNVYYV